MPRDKEKKPRKTPGVKKVHKATTKQRQQKISKSGKPKGEESKPTVFQFFRTDRFSAEVKRQEDESSGHAKNSPTK
jgi:hypothetical protein